MRIVTNAPYYIVEASPGSLTAANYTQSYTYDTLDRLQSGPLGSYSYGDAAHLHAVTSIANGGTTAYSASYDAGGNMTCRAADGTTTCAGTPTGAQLSYDNEGRLTAWQNTPSAPTTTDSFLSDGEGNRVEQQTTTNGSIITSTVYVAGGLEEITNSGSTSTLTKYFQVAGLPLVERVGTNGPLTTLASDGQGTVSEALDGGGNVLSAQLYTPYGSVRYSSGSSPTSLGYTGQRADSATGLDYYHARYYDPVAGQFTSADTAQDGPNPYGYVHGNPTTHTDPTGHRLYDGSDGGNGDLFYENYLRMRANAHVIGGRYLAPDPHPANAKSQQNASPAVYTLAHNVAVAQDNLGGSGAIREKKRVPVPTAGQASITIYAASDTSHEHPLETIYTDVVVSQGKGRHAEQLSIDEAAAKVKEFIAKYGGDERFQFDINVMAGLEPCTDCQLPREWGVWQEKVSEAIGIEGCIWAGELCRPVFRLRMWYLSWIRRLPGDHVGRILFRPSIFGRIPGGVTCQRQVVALLASNHQSSPISQEALDSKIGRLISDLGIPMGGVLKGMSTEYTSLCLRLRARALYASNGIHYPPVAEAQIEAAEVRLGFQLPPLLRELYMTVANGADFFAPGEWFHGIVDENETRPDIPTIEGFVGDGPRSFDPKTINLLRAHPGSYIVCDDLPAGFVALTHVGCGIYVYLDGYTGHLYVRDALYENGEVVGAAFSWCAQSVEEWVERTLALSPCDSSEAMYLPHYPLAAVLAGNVEDTTDKLAAETPTRQPAPQQATQAANPREQLRLHLQHVREEIVRQIHQLDALNVYAQEVGSSLAQDIDQSEITQRLADAEAQIYALEDEARFPE